ncbi:hypothetical protein AB3G45_13855 [Shinella sp. S4-D37]|uniref:hypothetical protein n=1 Tax=Shinella sp. S4-D37 TaxID=3161999 RepID=UPI003465592B
MDILPQQRMLGIATVAYTGAVVESPMAFAQHEKGGRMNVSWTSQAYEPEELTSLKAAFDEITSQIWFRPSEEAKKGFAKYLFATYPAGLFDRQRHFDEVEAVARQYYARDEKAAR